MNQSNCPWFESRQAQLWPLLQCRRCGSVFDKENEQEESHDEHTILALDFQIQCTNNIALCPSISQNKKLWTAVALQQEMMKNSSLLLPGCSNRSKRATRASGNSDKLSLAQRMGIVDLPEPPLSSEQWTAIERLAVERNHVSDPCPICMEPLGVKEKQMILDCSHIFHIDCFRNFERFTRMNMDAKLQCPMCRKEEYKKRITGEARKVYLHLCAVRIQSLWRGYRIRRMFRKDLLKRNPAKKREYYAKKIHTLNEKLISHQLAQDRAVDQLLLQTEYNLQKSRLSYLDEDKWHIIYQKALARGYDACPICMCDMDDSTKPCVITSCTHCFHAQCLSSFESFNPMVNRLSCPSCRAPYLKRNMSSFVP